MRRILPIVLFSLLSVGGAVGGDATTLVICAPGYPSNSEEAQPTMDALSRAIEISGGLAPDDLEAVYQPSIDGGLAALGEAALALVPLPFYLEYRERLGMTLLILRAGIPGVSEQEQLRSHSAVMNLITDL